jgi:MAF protein
MPEQLILASTSIYRKELLQRLHLPFRQQAPDFDEAPPGTLPVADLIRHNTLGKGRSVANSFPDATVIASDQLAVCDDLVLGKPGTVDAACAQLASLSGECVTFLTGVAMLRAHDERFAMVPFKVWFRDLSASEIHAYVLADRPLDCAGSFKSEGLGISLFSRMQGDDPTALIGLPLIQLSEWLMPLRRL